MEIRILVTSPESVIPPAWAAHGSLQSAFTPEAREAGRVDSREHIYPHFMNWTKQRLRRGVTYLSSRIALEDPELEPGLLLCQADGLAVAIPGFACGASYSAKTTVASLAETRADRSLFPALAHDKLHFLQSEKGGPC